MATKDISDAQVCRAYAEAKTIRGVFAETILVRMTGQPEKVCFRAMERAEGRGLIEYGVSLRAGWLTDAGLQLLKDSDG